LNVIIIGIYELNIAFNITSLTTIVT